MRLISFIKNNKASAGVLSISQESVFPIDGYDDALTFLSAGEHSWAAVAKLAQHASRKELIPLSKVTLLSPLPRPGKIICIGVNYRDHAAETKLPLPKVPEVFAKFTSSIVGDGDQVVIPTATKQPDYEAEFGVVIGKTCHRAAAEDWQQYVFGYTIVNDVSARDIQFSTSQWSMGKSFDTFCPIGPAVVSKDEIPDPHVLNIKLSIDGQVLQDSNTRQLIFKVPELIAYLSSIVRLDPGDLISTGTPSGVGFGRNPQRWLKPGETMRAEVERIGSLTNPIVAEAERAQRSVVSN
jgi:2-keto-4-pentenoate hydratase/2-oxohepta-3-ene-1,7-dioic acid hydratase in catechol pathway